MPQRVSRSARTPTSSRLSTLCFGTALLLAYTTVASADWGFRKSLTIDRSEVGVSGTSQTTLSDFTILVHVTDLDLRTTANGGEVTDAQGDDISFAAIDSSTCGGSLNACALYFEIESYSASTGELVAWVRIPSLNTIAASTDTVIYLYYGNSAVTSPIEDPENTWDTSTKGVWHLHDDFLDSTSNDNDGTNFGSSDTTGIVDDGQDFDGTNDYVQTTSGELSSADDFTVSVWFNSDDMTFARHLIWQGDGVGNGFGSVGFDEQEMHITMGGYNSGNLDDIVSVTLGDANTNDASGTLFVSTALSDTTNFHHVVAVFENIGSSPALELYLDGVSVATDTGTTARTGRGNWDTNLRIGRPGASDRYFNGVIDEVRVSDTARDGDWVRTEYNTINDPGDIGSPGFYTVGSEEADPPTLVTGLKATAEMLRGGVSLRWSTDSEKDNLGFFVHRTRAGSSQRLTPSILAGSALKSSSTPTAASGARYSWNDANGNARDRYWLETIALSGTRTTYGPFIPVLAPTPAAGQTLNPPPPSPSAPRSLSARRVPRAVSAQRPLTPSGAAAVDTLAWAQSGLEPSEVQRAIAASSAIKIQVKEPGWYRVSATTLFAAGLPTSVDPRNLHLFSQGRELAIEVDGEADGQLDPGDSVQFWGTGDETPWSHARVYWLVLGNRIPLRIVRQPSFATSVVTSRHYSWQEVATRERSVYFPSLLNRERQNFFGALISDQGHEQRIKTPFAVRTTGSAPQLEVQLQGVTETLHRVRVRWNLQDLGLVEFTGRDSATRTFSLPATSAIPSLSRVSFVAENGSSDFSFVESIRVGYWRSNRADGDELHFTTQKSERPYVHGFRNADIRVIDTTDPLSVRMFTPTPTTHSRLFSVAFDPRTSERTNWYAWSNEAIRSPVDVWANLPSRIGTQPGTTVIAITNNRLWDAASDWQALRESEGWSIELIDVEDVYDEFSFGAKSALAIRAFLEDLSTRVSTPPSHVVLIGDATYDPRGFLSNPNHDLIPTWLVDTENLETASDDGFADFDRDGVADWPIGRIPVRTPDQLQRFIEKLVAFGRRTMTSTLLVADADDGGFGFEQSVLDLATTIPPTITVEQLFRSNSADPPQEFLAKLRLNPALVNYSGHGSRLSLGGDFLPVTALGQISGAVDPFVSVSMTCLAGYFHEPFEDSISEALLNLEDRGAVAVWSSSGLCRATGQRAANLFLFRALFSGASVTIGEAVRQAKLRISDLDVRRSWNLLGDPLVRLPAP